MTGTDQISTRSKRAQCVYFPVSPAVVVEDRQDESGELTGYIVQINSRGQRGYLPWYNLPTWYSPLESGDAVAAIRIADDVTGMSRLPQRTLHRRG